MPRKDVPCAGCGITVPAPASRYQHEARCPACAPAWQEARAERKRAYNAKRARTKAALARAARVGACLDCGAETRPNLTNRFARLPLRCPTCSQRRADERGRANRREWMRRYRAQKRV